MQRTGSFFGTLLTFGLLGPFVAGVGVFIPYALGWAKIGIHPVTDPSQLGALLMLCLLFSYWLGGAAALATGLIASLVSVRIKGLLAWLGFSVVIGLLCTTASVAVMSILGGEPPNSRDFPGILVLFGGAAVVASLVGALASNGIRPRWSEINGYQPELKDAA